MSIFVRSEHTPCLLRKYVYHKGDGLRLIMNVSSLLQTV